MLRVIRSLAVLITAVALGVQTAAVALSANTTALIMGGTFHPLAEPRDPPDFVTAYLDNAVAGHLDPAFGGPVTNRVAVVTPEDFFPLGSLTFDRSVAEGLLNLNRCVAASVECVYNTDVGSVAPQLGDTMMVFGYSQSAVIASLAKRELIENYTTGDPVAYFMTVANPMRPNGGVLMRFDRWPTIPILGISFYGASPTDSAPDGVGGFAFPGADFVRQYDGLGGDFPVRPLNLIATLNALMGYGLLHGETVDVPFEQGRYQGSTGDTDYYLIPTDLVPLLQPLAFIIPRPILAAVDAPLRVLIEDAYSREVEPGTPTRMRWWPVGRPVALVRDLLKSVPVAIDNFFEGYGRDRVLGTTAPGPFGVGGPELPGPAEPEAQEHVSTVQMASVSGNAADENAPLPEPELEPEPEPAAEPEPEVGEVGGDDTEEIEQITQDEEIAEVPEDVEEVEDVQEIEDAPAAGEDDDISNVDGGTATEGSDDTEPADDSGPAEAA